ncbi:MAG: alpha/beta hydrolase [Rubrobacter sp.]|nr:alpha/beta hydrolase [Rubrobacter sp.]
MPQEWNLRRRLTLSAGEVAYDVLGFGPPLILVHGTPTSSYLWRNIAIRLADRFSVYTFDLLGFGQSRRRDGQDVSIPAQARLLAELVETLGLEAPSVAGHDIGGAITLHAHLLEGVPFDCIALIDSVALRPWITPPTNHVKAHLDTYETMPTEIFEAIIAAHLRTATYHPVDDATFAAYHDQWKGELGQRLYLQKDAQLDEDDTAELEPLLPSIAIPVRILWGEQDAWLSPTIAERLHELIPGSDLVLLPETGHFAMEDNPNEVARILFEFFSKCTDTSQG